MISSRQFKWIKKYSQTNILSAAIINGIPKSSFDIKVQYVVAKTQLQDVEKY